MRPYLDRLRQAQADLREECGRCERTIPILRDVERCPHRETCAVPRCLNQLERAVVGAQHPDTVDPDDQRALEARLRDQTGRRRDD